MKKLQPLILFLVLLLTHSLVLADGFPVKDGRYAGGAVVLLKLTEVQSEQIRNKFISGMVIQLTKDQQEQIKSEAKLKVPPTKLEIYHAIDLANDCTCFVANVGFDFKPGWIDVPIAYLFSDEDAERHKPDPNG
jgi:hypothetical protein